MIEGMLAKVWKDTLDVDIPTPFLRMTHDDAMRDYGCDKNQRNAKVLQQISGIFTVPQHGIPLKCVSAQSADDPRSCNQDAHTSTSYHSGCDTPRK